jgi:hypothetical protein
LERAFKVWNHWKAAMAVKGNGSCVRQLAILPRMSEQAQRASGHEGHE